MTGFGTALVAPTAAKIDQWVLLDDSVAGDIIRLTGQRTWQVAGAASSPVGAEPSRAVGHDLQEPTGHTDVFHEVEHLARVVRVVMRDQSRRDTPQRQRRSQP